MFYHIQTFGCQANKADSQRMASVLEDMGYDSTENFADADIIILNTCSVRQSAEDRVYSRMTKLRELKKIKPQLKIVVAGCMIGPRGQSPRDTAVTERLEGADRFIGTQDYSRLWEIFRELTPQPREYLHPKSEQQRNPADQGYVLISSGCNNFCTFCIVPYARGKEISRPFAEILSEVQALVSQGITNILLLGQNVNSYGADLVLGKPLGGDRAQFNELRKLRRQNRQSNQDTPKLDHTLEAFVPGPFHDLSEIAIQSENATYTLPSGQQVQPIQVKHLGKIRVPTLFPYLLAEVAKIEGVKNVSFISANPWDFSDELISTIAKYPNIDRHIHLPVQSGDNDVLKRMNRWYTREDYLDLITKIRTQIPQATFGTDLIVGFPGETEAQFQNTYALCQQVGFKIGFIAEYSIRPGTGASLMRDDVGNPIKKTRFRLLDELINGVAHSKISKPQPIAKSGTTSTAS